MTLFCDKSKFALALLSFFLCYSYALKADTTNSSFTPSPVPPPLPQQKSEEQPFPWLTGPLLTQSAHVIPAGHYNIEPYEFITTNYGAFDKNWHTHSSPNNFYNLITLTIVQIGLPCNFDTYFEPSWSWNHISGASHWVLNDMAFGFDYQILNDKNGERWPAIKLNVQGNLPIGRYQKLQPNDKGTDIGGSGSWSPSIGLVFDHLFWWGGHIFFAPRFNVQYTFPTPVHVKNLNAYGGGHHTRGKVFPGQSLAVLFGFEISLSQKWVFANDFRYLHINKTRFKGRKGATKGVPNVIGLPSSEQFSLAPAIEFNWSAYCGIIGGVWFSFAGRNQVEFVSGVVAINIYH